MINSSKSGLTKVEVGLGGQVYQTTTEIYIARERHSRRLEFIDKCGDGPSGGRLLMQLVCNEMVLFLDALKQMASANADLYQVKNDAFVEWTDPNGWRDRRKCSKQTVDVIHSAGGIVIGSSDWRWARRQLSVISPECPQDALWDEFIADAQAWWHERLTGPVFGHVTGVARFQLLDRRAFARRYTGLPEKPHTDADIEVLDKQLAVLDSSLKQSKITVSFESLVQSIGLIARAKPDMAVGRQEIKAAVDGLVPVAHEEGYAQVLVLLAVRHAIEYGGISGRLWAPVTVWGYTAQARTHLLPKFIELGGEECEGERMLAMYEEMILHAVPSQRVKFRAFLEVFHRFLVIVGWEPLPKSLAGAVAPLPPDAADICPRARDRALLYVQRFAPTEQIRLQCLVKIKLGGTIPLRTYEPWCIRLVDVHEQEPVFLDICPRRLDGQAKSLSLRRQEGIDDLGLIQSLINLKALRRGANATDSDLLFGEPGQPGLRHEQDLCMRLVNSALRWATGNPRASFYDLRHTVFTERAQPLLTGNQHEIESFDGYAYADMSTSGGHAGPSSTRSYVNRVEDSIAHFSVKNRPEAWNGYSELSLDPEIFGDLIADVIDSGSISLDSCQFDVVQAPPKNAYNVSGRHRILDRIADGLNLNSIAGECQVSLGVVKQVLIQFTQVAAQIQLVDYKCTRSELGQLEAVSANALWAQHARQSKYSGIRAQLEQLVSDKNFPALNQLWQSWLGCRHHGFLALTNPRPALVLIKFLLEAGVFKRNMIIISEPGAAPLDVDIRRFGLSSRSEGIERNGRAAHRLFFTASGINAMEANAATLCVYGFNWWMLLVGSVLLANEQI